MENKELKDLVLENEKNNEVTLMTVDGLAKINIDKLIDQHIDGLLYDLNRDKASILTLAEGKSKRWINDYASACVIERLKEQNNELVQQINELRSNEVKQTSLNKKEEKTNTPINTMHGYRIDGISDEKIFQM